MAMMRIKQGLRALFAWSRTVEFELAERYLSPSQMDLFRRMRKSEQLHSLNVLRMLLAQGQDHPTLMIAALLHDVGKSRAAFHLWDRTLVVLVRAVAPQLVKQWGQHPPKGWYRPFAVSVQHPQWSAELVTEAGADPLTIDVIRRHQEHFDHPPQNETERLMLILQSADDAN
jgi:hypothetical protein